MKHADFRVGTEFFAGSGKWHCTDIGTRVIVAISLEPPETVERSCDKHGLWQERRFLSDDPRDLIGPPYSVAEEVFDEYDLAGCCRTPDEVPGLKG